MPFHVLVQNEGMVKIPDDILKVNNYKPGDVIALELGQMTGQSKTYKQLETEASYAMDYEISLETLQHYLPMWLKNFKLNFPYFGVGVVKSHVDIPPADDSHKRCVVVANGPSLYEMTDLSHLRGFQGTIVSANKPLIHLLKNGVVPDYVCALDAEPEVLASFDHKLVRKHSKDIKGVLIPTAVDNSVAKFCMKYFGRERTFWMNPHFGAEIAPNICETLCNVTKIPACQHGGNVGSLSYYLAIRPLYCTPIGLLGYDLSYPPNPEWTLDEASQMRFFYLPEKNKFYGMIPPFEYYLTRLLELWKVSKEVCATTYNLTPLGPLNAVIGLPQSSLEDFVKDSRIPD